jgi:hypothetical protein
MTVIVWLLCLYLFIGITGVSLRLTHGGSFKEEFLKEPSWDARTAWYFAQVLCWWTVFRKRKIGTVDKEK